MKRMWKNTLLIFIAVLALTLTSCNKSPQTVKGFCDTMQAKGFEVKDISSTLENKDITLAAYSAVCENYQISYGVAVDAKNCKSMFENAMNVYDEQFPSRTGSLELSYGNYNYCAFTSGDTFCLVSRIDNTMLYAVADKRYRNEIEDYVDALGY